MTFEPTLESVRTHAVPDWFHDAKLGIFVHWGLYSIPGWAPTTGPLPEVIASQGWQGWFSRNPYAEWYMNSIRVPGSVYYKNNLKTQVRIVELQRAGRQAMSAEEFLRGTLLRAGERVG